MHKKRKCNSFSAVLFCIRSLFSFSHIMCNVVHACSILYVYKLCVRVYIFATER